MFDENKYRTCFDKVLAPQGIEKEILNMTINKNKNAKIGFGRRMVVVAAVLAWQGVFISSGAFLIVMGFLVFLVFTLFERKGFVKYNLYINENKQKNSSLALN